MNELTVERKKFWSDDFDMDLLKVFPQTEEMCGDLATTQLWTVGHQTHGRLNHPTVWNAHGAFLWTEVPLFSRDKYGWFNIQGCVSDEPLIECTWLEWLRDQWAHTYGAIILPRSVRLPISPQNEFMELMYDLRGWHKLTDAKREIYRARAIGWIDTSNDRLRQAL